jgi:hypothetical protein
MQILSKDLTLLFQYGRDCKSYKVKEAFGVQVREMKMARLWKGRLSTCRNPIALKIFRCSWMARWMRETYLPLTARQSLFQRLRPHQRPHPY